MGQGFFVFVFFNVLHFERACHAKVITQMVTANKPSNFYIFYFSPENISALIRNFMEIAFLTKNTQKTISIIVAVSLYKVLSKTVLLCKSYSVHVEWCFSCKASHQTHNALVTHCTASLHYLPPNPKRWCALWNVNWKMSRS